MASSSGTKLTPEQIKVFQDAFRSFDKNKDGKISLKELEKVLQSLGMVLTEITRDELRHLFDKGGAGLMDMDEFMTFVIRKTEETEELKTGGRGYLRQVFNIFDRDRNGYIGPSELRWVMEALGEWVTDEDAKAMVDVYDKMDGDGRLSYEEFKAMLTKLGIDLTKGIKKS